MMFDELEAHQQREEKMLFPTMLQGGCSVVQFPIRRMMAEHDDVHRQLAALRTLTCDHTAPDGACRTWRALVDACRKLAPEHTADAAAAAVLDDVRVRQKIAALLHALARRSPGSSTRVTRAILMAEPPSMDKGEMTDKGSINQRAVLKNRAALVDELYATPLSSRVIAIEGD